MNNLANQKWTILDNPQMPGDYWVVNKGEFLIDSVPKDRAMLISAAPELLRALEGLVEWLEADDAKAFVGNLLTDARLAIAKVHGTAS